MHTQIKFPNRATIRTIFAGIVGAASLIPVIAVGLWHGSNTPAIVTQLVVVSGIVTRILANQKVNDLLDRFLPWLSAAPAGAQVGASD